VVDVVGSGKRNFNFHLTFLEEYATLIYGKTKGDKMKNTKYGKAVKITDPLEMVGFIRTNGTQCQFISMLTVTVPKLKVACPYKGVVKVSRRNGLINMNYNKAVRTRIAKALGVPLADAEYENGKTWFVHQTDENGKALPLVKNATKDNGKHYLQYFPIRSSGTKYIMANGEEVTEEQLQPYFYSRPEREEYKPVTCVFDVANIKTLHASKVTVLTDGTEAAEEVLA
jgi:hypothetical protein